MEQSSIQLVKHSFIYGASDMMNRILAFILIPVYTRYFSPQDYGALQLFIIIANIGVVIVQLGLSSAIFKSILYHEDSNQREIINTSFYSVFIFSCIVLVPCWFFSGQLSVAVFNTATYTPYFRVLFATLFFRSFSLIPLAKLRIENKSVTFSILICTQFLLQLIMNIVFVVILRKGIFGILLSECIVACIFSIVYVGSLGKTLGLFFSFKDLKELLGFGVPLVPAALSMFVLTMSDRFFLKHYSTLTEVGYYSLGYRFGMIIGILVGAFQKAWPSAMFAIAKKENPGRIYSKNFTYFLLVLFSLSLVLSLFAKDILRLLATEKFLPGYQTIPIISFAFICNGVYYFTAIGLNLKKKTVFQPFIVGTAALLNLLLNWIFIPRWGTIGAASSTLVSFFVMAVLSTRISLKYFYVPYEYRRIIIICITSVSTILIAGVIGIEQSFLSLLAKSGLFCVYFVVLFILGVIDKKEGSMVLSTIKNTLYTNRNDMEGRR